MSATRFQLAWPDGVCVTALMLRRKVACTFSICRVALCGALVLFGASRSSAQTLTQPADWKHTTLTGRVMVGYQGWFRAVGDGTPLGWAHYRTDSGKFETGFLNVDYWPDVSEGTPDGVSADKTRTTIKKYAVNTFKLPDGSVPYVYSSSDPGTIRTHFDWMVNYGITGVFVQRFAECVTNAWLDSMDLALITALDEAARTGRSVAIMYDLSGLDFGQMEQVLADWTKLVTKFGVSKGGDVRKHPAYQWHRGKPVIAVYGVGFKENRNYTIAETKQLLERLKAGGNTVMVGVSDDWFSQTGLEDAPPLGQVRHGTMEPKVSEMLAEVKVDVISPWTPGRFKDLGEARWHIEKRKKERDWCVQNKIDYMGVVFPGFSDVNLKWNRDGKDNTQNRADRDDGRFLWEQYLRLADAGCTMVYQAMFDEMDEGTQIFKVLAKPPLSPKPETNRPDLTLQSYEPLPPDYYLRLVGRATAEFRRKISQGAGFISSFPDRIPNFADGADAEGINQYLRQQEEKEKPYELAERSYQTNKSLDLIAAWVLPYAPFKNYLVSEWTLVKEWEGQEMKILVAGNDWNARHTNAGKDPNASVIWEFTPHESGIYTLYVRHPGDRFEQHADNAVLQVISGSSPPWSPQPLNLRTRTMQFNKIGDLKLEAKIAVQLKLSLPPGVQLPTPDGKSGSLMMFEPKFVKMGPIPSNVKVRFGIDP